VSGIVAVSQSGTWTVQPGNTANTTAWLVTGLGGTFPATQSGTWNITNISGTITLPTGAATGAKQDTANTSLASIDGKITAVNTGAVVVSSSALPTGAATSTKQSDGSQKTQIVDGAGNVIGATSNALDINIKSGNPTTIAVTQGTATNLKTQAEAYQGGAAVASGNPLQVTLANTGANATAVKVDGSAATQPVNGTVTVQQGTASSLNATIVGTGTLAVQESGAALTALQLIDDVVYTDDTSTHATGTSKVALIGAVATPTDGSVNANDIGAVAMTTDRKLHVSVQDALPAGTNAIGKLSANSGVDIGDVDVTSVSGNVTVVQGTATNLKAQAEAYQGGTAVGSGNPLQVTLANTGANTNKLLVTPDANSAVNVAQMNGVTVTMGNGTSGTGVQRVAVASDNTAVSGFGVGATGSAVPANAVYTGGINQAGNLVGDILCDKQKIYDASTNGSTELVAVSGSTHVYICGYSIVVGATATNVKLTAGTGTNCGSAASGATSTGTSGANAGLTPAHPFAANGGMVVMMPRGTVIDAGSANAVCINSSAGNAVTGQIWYQQR